jgi:diguanylate cyclase (GGDEF)-like protein
MLNCAYATGVKIISEVVKTEGTLDEIASTAQHPPLDLRLVLAMAGERPMNEREKQQAEKLQAERGEGLFTDLLYALTRKQFPSRQAKTLWGDIGHHRTRLQSMLGRDPGVAVAAHDYLSNVTRLTGTMGLIEENKLRALSAAASHDGLTGLYDKATFSRLLREEINRQSRRKRPTTLLMADIDHFKKINDTFGHADGDTVIQQVADILRQQARTSDVVGRCGGEEFGVMMPEEELDAGRTAAERIRLAIERHFHNTPYKATISIGVATYKGSDIPPESAADELSRAADTALYQAKRAGRNRVSVAS